LGIRLLAGEVFINLVDLPKTERKYAISISPGKIPEIGLRSMVENNFVISATMALFNSSGVGRILYM
jgi:hypothetical protein